MKLVKVGRVGSKVQEVVMGDNATVDDCLRAANLTVDASEDIFLNHVISYLDTTVSNNAILILETRKVAPAMKDLIDMLIDLDAIEAEYDDYDELDYAYTLEENADTISDITEAVRRL